MISAEDCKPHRAGLPSIDARFAINSAALLKNAQKLSESLSSWRHDLHRMPEVGLNTFETARYLAHQLDAMSCKCSIGTSNEVVAIIGEESAPCLLLRADTDGLPIVERSGEPWISCNGCSHACGHDMHAASLLGAAWLLKKQEFKIHLLGGCIKLLFQPGEEILAGARKTIANGVLTGPRVDAAFALHVNGRCPMGLMLYGEKQSAGLWGFQIRLIGRGGHGSMPQKCIDPIAGAVHVYLAIEELISDEFSFDDETVLSVGKIAGGNAANTIPDCCIIEGTARAFDFDILIQIKKRISEVVQSVSVQRNIKAEIKTLSFIPPLVVDENMTRESLSYVGAAEPDIRFRGIQHTLGAEDFALFSEKVPSAYFTVGAAVRDSNEHYSMHDSRIRFDDGALPICAAAYAAVALGWLADHHKIESSED